MDGATTDYNLADDHIVQVVLWDFKLTEHYYIYIHR